MPMDSHINRSTDACSLLFTVSSILMMGRAQGERVMESEFQHSPGHQLCIICVWSRWPSGLETHWEHDSRQGILQALWFSSGSLECSGKKSGVLSGGSLNSVYSLLLPTCCREYLLRKVTYGRDSFILRLCMLYLWTCIKLSVSLNKNKDWKKT